MLAWVGRAANIAYGISPLLYAITQKQPIPHYNIHHLQIDVADFHFISQISDTQSHTTINDYKECKKYNQVVTGKLGRVCKTQLILINININDNDNDNVSTLKTVLSSAN